MAENSNTPDFAGVGIIDLTHTILLREKSWERKENQPAGIVKPCQSASSQKPRLADMRTCVATVDRNWHLKSSDVNETFVDKSSEDPETLTRGRKRGDKVEQDSEHDVPAVLSGQAVQQVKRKPGKAFPARALVPQASSLHLTAPGPLSTTVHPDMDVELSSGEFLRVVELFEDEDGRASELRVNGILMRRTRCIDDVLPKRCNELCAILEAETDERGEPAIGDCLVTRNASDIIAERRIIFTNRLFPACSFRRTGATFDDMDDVQKRGELVCRWKYVKYCKMVRHAVAAQCWVGLRKEESDAGAGVSDGQLMREWHGADRHLRDQHIQEHGGKKGKTSKRSTLAAMINLTSTEDDSDIEEITASSFQAHRATTNSKSVKKRAAKEVQFLGCHSTEDAPDTESTLMLERGFSFADFFCGAGGATMAAKRAGLRIDYVVDRERDACKTQQLNFPNAKVLEEPVFDFCVSRPESWMKVAVLHISSPCQPYSIAHSVPGKDDEANEAAGYTIIEILKRCRPRAVTLEQANNIVNGHPESFHAVINQFTSCGYSVRAKIVNFAEYGNVHPRKRLFVVASCPGQPLPRFPEPTHGPEVDKRRLTTIRDILNQVPATLESRMTRFSENARPAYDPDQQLRRCITTNGGGGNVHPEGSRTLNLQELAQMAGFVAEHEFVGNVTSIRRQIGNAVPSVAATPFFKEVVKSLRQFDEELALRAVEKLRPRCEASQRERGRRLIVQADRLSKRARMSEVIELD